ncbi:MAG: nucleotidyltransferase family protein [Nitrospirales bacterium]|nr:nucleotidyltransferase family protein [Nitrospirales bacterium]
MSTNENTVTALILAGSRPGKDPVAAYTGMACKVLARVGGERIIDRVLRATKEAKTIGSRILCGPSWEIVRDDVVLLPMIESAQIGWEEPQQGPSGSVQKFLETHPQSLPLLVTTGDHALLTSEIVDYFVKEASGMEADIVVGLTSYAIVKQAFPLSKRTVLRFGKEEFCGCNLFMFFNPQAIRLVQFWGHLEQDRKRPIRLIGHLGLFMVIRYLFGRITLRKCLNAVGKRFNLRIREVLLPFPQAAVDVDKPEDLHLVEAILSQKV